MLRQDADADLPRCNADDEGENDRSLTASDIEPDRSTGNLCQIECRLIHLIGSAVRLWRMVDKVVGKEFFEDFEIPAALHLFGVPANDCLRNLARIGHNIPPVRTNDSFALNIYGARFRHRGRNLGRIHRPEPGP